MLFQKGKENRKLKLPCQIPKKSYMSSTVMGKKFLLSPSILINPLDLKGSYDWIWRFMSNERYSQDRMSWLIKKGQVYMVLTDHEEALIQNQTALFKNIISKLPTAISWLEANSASVVTAENVETFLLAVSVAVLISKPQAFDSLGRPQDMGIRRLLLKTLTQLAPQMTQFLEELRRFLLLEETIHSTDSSIAKVFEVLRSFHHGTDVSMTFN
jgi:hypothetical protein